MKKDILGGFKGKDNSLITTNVTSVPSGKYSANEILSLRYRGSWPIWSVDEGRGDYFPSTGTGTVNFTQTLPQATHVIVVVAGGGGSGASDNDCQGQGPGGSGGYGKALVSLSSVGSNTANFNVGSGGNSVQGNDAVGNSGNSTTVTIGNFSITANGGGGGYSKNNGGSAGSAGNCNSNNSLLFSTSSVFYSPLLNVMNSTADVTFQTVRTNANGGGGGCGGSSGSGTNGFVYLRYGGGINASTTLTPAQDPPSSGNTHPYTAFY